MSGLYIVGSSLNGFGGNNSDLDICLMLTCKEVRVIDLIYTFKEIFGYLFQVDQRTDAVQILSLLESTFGRLSKMNATIFLLFQFLSEIFV